jgi:hypothetical protein
MCVLINYKLIMSEEEKGAFHGIAGNNNIFGFPHCETDRFWRQSLGITNERYIKTAKYHWDECNNAFVKPKPPISINLLDSLHKWADYE